MSSVSPSDSAGRPDTVAALTVQWHITTACGNRCRHCYMYDPATYEAERTRELSPAGLFRVLDSITAFEQQYGARVTHFAITGGDPLLRPEWRELLTTLRQQRRHLRLMGNPETLTDDNLKFLADSRLQRFQLSLDGLPATHDHLRGPGSFQRTVDGLRRLQAYGIPAQVMFTLNAENHDELLPLLRYVATQTAAASFSFDVIAAVGNAGTLPHRLAPELLHALFTGYLQEKERLRAEGHALAIREKPHLFKVLRLRRGETTLPESGDAAAHSGCLIGFTCANILADGTMLACRRFPLAVGKLPEQSFAEIFLGSPELRRFRRHEYFAGCGECRYFKVCRGCPAVVHGLTGDPFATPPFCFLTSAERSPLQPLPPSPPLTVSDDEEYAFIASHLQHRFAAGFRRELRDPECARAVMLLSDPVVRRQFSRDPDAFCRSHMLTLSPRQRDLLRSYLQLVHDDVRPAVETALFWRQFSGTE